MAKMKKITTIEQLAEAMQTGFAASDRKIDKLAQMTQGEFLKIRKEFGKVYDEFGKVNNEFGNIYGRFDKIDRDIGYIHGHLDLIEREISDIKEKLDKVVYRHELEALQARVERLEKIISANKAIVR